jgi:hypothetical protein
MKTTVFFWVGAVFGYHSWIAFLEHYAAASDVSVRGAIFWLGGMVLPFPILIGGLVGALCGRFVEIKFPGSPSLFCRLGPIVLMWWPRTALGQPLYPLWRRLKVRWRGFKKP